MFSIGVWSKVDLHLNGNIVGYQRAGGPKKLLVFGSSDLYAAVADYSSVAFHEKYLLPFYDCYLKGKPRLISTSRRCAISSPAPTASSARRPGRRAMSRYVPYYLGQGPTGSVTSLNDGALSTRRARQAQGGATVFDYPNPAGGMGVVGFGKDGRPDPVRRVLTFTTPPLERDLEVAGPIELILHAASSRNDTDFFVKLSEQIAAERGGSPARDLQPRSRIVTKGWLRASMRAIDKKLSRPHAPHYSHTQAADADAGPGLSIHDRGDADGLSLQAGQPHPPRAREWRFQRDRRRLRASLYAGQGRARHDPSRCALSLAAAAAGDGQ